MKIYRTLAAILHLGNVVFEETKEGKIKISNQSIDHFENCARLLNMDKAIFQQAVLTRADINGDAIR